MDNDPERKPIDLNDSTHLMPPADLAERTKRYDPIFASLPIAIGAPVTMLVLGIALELAGVICRNRGGFKVPEQNVIDIVSPQFLVSFFPTLLVIPLAFMWRELDRILRWYQPYVVLWNGHAPAEESVLLNYIALGPFRTMFKSFRYNHRVVFCSSLIVIVTYIFQPLAGSVLQIQQRPQTKPTSVTSTKTFGLAPDVNELNAFLSAAGFTEAAVFQGLSDPPFIKGGWATAEFTFPVVSGLNGTMVVNTTGIQTSVNCANPVNTTLQNNANGSFSLTSASKDECVHTVVFDPRVATLQYGVDDVPCPGNASSVDESFRPVMFWFFHVKSDGTPQAQTVFCAPSIKAFNVEASANLNNGSLYNVVTISDSLMETYMFSQPYNGVIFPLNNNTFIQARATAVRSGVSGAIFRFAAQMENGLQSTFDLSNGFLDITKTVYTQHLSVAAKSIYFIGGNNVLPAELTSLAPVLWIDALPAHTLAVILILSGLTGVVVQFLHHPQRRKLLLTAAPGSIAAVVSLTARSGFGDLLLPCDNEKVIRRKLSGLRFGLDRRTGAILADEDGKRGGPSGTMLPLMGEGHQPEYDVMLFGHSSLAVGQTPR